jgi:hypothetical protein
MILPPWLLAFGADGMALCDELERRRVTSQSEPPVTSQESVTLHCPTCAARRQANRERVRRHRAAAVT